MLARRTALLTAFGLGLLAAPAQAATFTVDTTTDSAPVANACTASAAPGQTCSLREAVAAANAAVGDDVISIPSGTYALSSAQPSITPSANVDIQGADARSTIIQGSGATRVFSPEAPMGTAVTIGFSDLTIAGGNSPTGAPTGDGDGGGILLSGGGTLNLNRVFVTANTAALNGGGVATLPEGSLTDVVNISNSTISGNSAGSATAMDAAGGGVLTGGVLTITNSTISGNTVTGTATARGGGISATGGSTSLVNTTVAANTVGGAVMSMGGGVQNVAALNATNTIVAGNTANGATDCMVPAAGATVANNLASDASCGFAATGGKDSTNPLLGDLADNGGPTRTMAIPYTSPAANAGTATGCPATDQRGVARPQGPACDIGAYEAAVPPPASSGPSGSAPVTGAPLASKPRTDPGKTPYLKVTGVPKSCRRTAFTIRVNSKVYGTGVKLKTLKIAVDGKVKKTVKKAGRFRYAVSTKKLKAGRHKLTVKVTDSKGRSRTFTKRFTRCGAKSKKTSKRAAR